MGVGRSVWRRLGRSMGLGGAPVRPRREDYATGEAWDRAYLAYQDAQMAELARRYPRAVLHTAVWHGCDLPPEVVLKSGIPAKDGWSFDLEAHQRETGRTPEESSALRGGCVDARTPGLFASEGQWVYLLVPRGGVISLADALRDRDLLPGETELSFGARQPAQQIQGWRKVLGFSETVGAYRLGPLEPNPNFDPRR